MTEAIGGLALLFSVGAVVFGVVRFHRARTALREASHDRMSQLMAELTVYSEPAQPDPGTDVPSAAEGSPGLSEINELAPVDDHPASAGEVDADAVDADEAFAPSAEASEAETVEVQPLDVRREMDAFFGGGLPPVGDARTTEGLDRTDA